MASIEVIEGPWHLTYNQGDTYGEISHDEFGPVEVIGYEGRPIMLSELAIDLETWVREHSADYMKNLTQSWT